MIYPIGVPVVCGTVLYLNRGRLDPHLIVATASANSDEKDAATKESAKASLLVEAVAPVRMDCDAAVEQRENDESVQ